MFSDEDTFYPIQAPVKQVLLQYLYLETDQPHGLVVRVSDY
jgi:hypothetical protein